MNTFVLLSCAVLASALTVLFVKKSILTNNIYWLIIPVLSEFILIFAYYNLFKIKNISIYYTLIKILSICLVILIGVFIYNEQITCYKIFGLLLSILVIYLLSK
jgi:multidrug transporter EmrE-like cation transporter